MNSFVATSPAPTLSEAVIPSSAFWPDVDPVKIRTAQRIDGTITPERLREALIEAISSVNNELSAWRAARIAEGYATLADVPSDTVDGVSINVHRYLRAIGCFAKSSLIERYRDFDTTAAGHKKADQLENPIDDLRRDARWAISAILGIGRNIIELI
jgi:hypothetical protein